MVLRPKQNDTGGSMVNIHLKQLLEQSSISQAELARGTGIRPSTICDLCNNNVSFLKLEHLEKICRFLHIQISDLVEILNE